ncbi:MAG: oligosaccharide flippase family protein [Candidatus Bathyarchaeia archaeon]|jgi:O-antigen/teichoic acid export membrane protein
MSKGTEMAKVSARGGFNLMWGLIASTVISFVGILAITYILGAQNYGLYSIALVGPTLIATFRDCGVNSAMVKYSAQYNVEDKTRIRGIIVSGLVFEIALGLSLSLLSFALSPFIASSLHRPTIVPLIQIASFFILSGALVNSATAAFTGLEIMHYYSFMLIIQSTIKTGLIIGLVLLGFGTLGAITGYTVSALIAGLAGVIIVWSIYRLLPKSSTRTEIISTIKTMLGYGIPVSIGTILTGLLTAFYSYILAFYVTNNALIGNYNLAINFSILITFFATPVTTMLFPAFSKLDYRKDHDTLKTVFQYSVKYASLIVVPVAALVIALAQPGVGFIYRNSYSSAPLFLALLSVTYLYAALGSLSISNLLLGQGFTKFNLGLSVLQVGIGVPVGFLLISQFGVVGLIATSLTVGLPSLFVGLSFLKKKFGVSVDWLSSVKILLSSGIAAGSTYILISKLPLAAFRFVSVPLEQLVIGIIVFPIIFVLAAIVTRTIDRGDLTTLRQISDALGPLRGLVRFLLNVIEKLMGGSNSRYSIARQATSD